jgi:PAS domain-containing protein
MVSQIKLSLPLVTAALAPRPMWHADHGAHRPALLYGLMVAGVCAAALLTSAAWSFLSLFPGTLFLVSIAMGAWAGGLGPGLAATVLSAVALDVLLVRQPHGLASGTRHAVGLALFFLVGVLIAVLSAAGRLAADAIARSRGLLHATLDSLSVPVAILDREGIIVAENAVWRRVFCPGGVGDAGARGTRYLDVWTPEGGEGRAAIALGMGEVFGGTCPEFLGEFSQWRGGEHRWFAVRVTRFDGDGGARALVIHEDITERKLVEEAERDEQTLRSVARLASAAAHEINNPLAIIMGNIEIIAQQVHPSAADRIRPTLDAIERIRVIVQRMTSITNLEFSRQSPRLPEMLDLRRSSTASPAGLPDGRDPGGRGDSRASHEELPDRRPAARSGESGAIADTSARS